LGTSVAHTTGPARTETRISHGCAAHSKFAGKSARYESIHKAVQYKNSGTTQIGIMNESDVITMGLKEDFQCPRKAAAPEGGWRAKLHYLMQNKVTPLHEGIVKIPQRASGFDRVVEISR